MARRRAFDMCHPSVNLLYFLLVLGCSVGCMHPACLGISLGGALACGLLFRGRRAVGRLLGLLGPVALLAAGGNLLLVRQGETVLARLPGGRPLTLESALYGLAAACLLGAVVLWFASWQAVLTADKITYLFGRIAPALALLLSLTLSFVPRLRRRLEETDRAQRGLLGQPRRRLDKVGWGAALLSSLLGWSLENAIETADTMRSRGYGPHLLLHLPAGPPGQGPAGVAGPQRRLCGGRLGGGGPVVYLLSGLPGRWGPGEPQPAHRVSGPVPDPTGTGGMGGETMEENNQKHWSVRESLSFQRQVSETMRLGILLALSGGLMDAYSYLFRGEVFANAQTGNILLCSVALSQGEWGVAVQYAFPVLAFGLGILMTFLIRQRFRNRTNRIHWRQLGVLAEILLLTLVAFLPQQANLLANSLISLACGFQVEAFRKIHGNAIATTMCIGNLRAGIHAAAEFGFSRKREDRNRAITYFTVILAFALGAVLGNLAIAQWGTWAILGSSALLLVCFGLMFFQGKEGEGHGTA